MILKITCHFLGVVGCLFIPLLLEIKGLRLNGIPGYLDGHVVRTLRTPRAVLCGERCFWRSACASFNFHPLDNRCDLNKASKGEHPDDFVNLQAGDEPVTYHELQENIGIYQVGL